MYKVDTPISDEDFEHYFHLRWERLRQPWNFPLGSEKDEYETVGEHRMVRDSQGNVVAVGRVHLNTAEEAQIRHIAVAKSAEGKGLGKLVLSALENEARRQGATRLVTNSRELSIPFFSACGFEVEQEAPNELGQLRRQQMVKQLTDMNTIMLHPKWCQLLQETWHDTIPISEQMGIKLHQYSGSTLEVRASLNKNINLHGTMFAGSIFSLATLTGWGMIFLKLKEKDLTGEIVLGDGDIHYHKPITQEPRAICNIETLDGKFSLLERKKKSCIKLQVDILDGDTPVAEFKGVYWVLPSRDDPTP
ncbi:bifunctional GNAT family N-acetyltransferase/hotdog fold thioesterase [Aestuariibacter halophilus]|uniref:Bifunctional GNAT family N-acetyltransferase/hotdog fold thioesterase n=1 Tax=Fluctibacter halophilus TaxID=226011 RepID=A0ABS8G9C7_9ALTE|nr:bifunctional GNAT family N-acetyltransferase/hotdog fold thioesterase [Aestuariibacter halophilus]MCC2617172.1 bifunctional GNAT family N-acetyltransferase/hotdog fold thioesterase [Aestuariibacter halophilus]